PCPVGTRWGKRRVKLTCSRRIPFRALARPITPLTAPPHEIGSEHLHMWIDRRARALYSPMRLCHNDGAEESKAALILYSSLALCGDDAAVRSMCSASKGGSGSNGDVWGDNTWELLIPRSVWRFGAPYRAVRGCRTPHTSRKRLEALCASRMRQSCSSRRRWQVRPPWGRLSSRQTARFYADGLRRLGAAGSTSKQTMCVEGEGAGRVRAGPSCNGVSIRGDVAPTQTTPAMLCGRWQVDVDEGAGGEGRGK
ncbi:hypothetical protein BV25DRAFT_1843224, partial [Artomyces pyxidatus]